MNPHNTLSNKQGGNPMKNLPGDVIEFTKEEELEIIRNEKETPELSRIVKARRHRQFSESIRKDVPR